MPFISVNVTEKLNDTQKDQIKAGLGEKITIIPGKIEKTLMVNVIDDQSIYMAGEKIQTAYIDVKIYGTADFEVKKAFTDACFEVISEATSIPANQMYLTISDFENWGTRGTLK